VVIGHDDGLAVDAHILAGFDNSSPFGLDNVIEDCCSLLNWVRPMSVEATECRPHSQADTLLLRRPGSEGSAEMEKRTRPRMRTYKRGRIVFGNPVTIFDCIIKNQSDGGAKLAVASPIGIPDKFDLMDASGNRRPVKVVWRTANLVGVEFLA
jgi:hypothetical protein